MDKIKELEERIKRLERALFASKTPSKCTVCGETGRDLDESDYIGDFDICYSCSELSEEEES